MGRFKLFFNLRFPSIPEIMSSFSSDKADRTISIPVASPSNVRAVHQNNDDCLSRSPATSAFAKLYAEQRRKKRTSLDSYDFSHKMTTIVPTHHHVDAVPRTSASPALSNRDSLVHSRSNSQMSFVGDVWDEEDEEWMKKFEQEHLYSDWHRRGLISPCGEYVYLAPCERPPNRHEMTFLVNDLAPKFSNYLSSIEFGVRTDDFRRVIFKTIPNPKLAECELQALRDCERYRSPHIIRALHHFYDDKQQMVLVLPRLQLIPFHMAMDACEAIRIVRDALLALSVVHDAGWVHLDVNPSNLMSDRCGRTVLIDFGLAQPLAGIYGEDGQAYFPRCGTPGFVAPEVQRGEGNGVKADMYSLGVVMGMLLSPYFPDHADALSALGCRAVAAGTDTVRAARAVFQSAIEGEIWVPDCIRYASQCVYDMMEENPCKRPSAKQLLARSIFQCDVSCEWVSVEDWQEALHSMQRQLEGDWYDEDNYDW
jgi:hypothetical protein